jgi:predicted enzyme related to lactoylglutathione lyase
MKNTIIWFEINVADLARAKKFYDHVLQTNIRKEEIDGYPPMGIIPDEGVNGALVEDEEYEAPEHSGVMLYFDGHWAVISDLDGNVLAFFEPPK